MEHKDYIKFLSQVASSSAGSIVVDGVQIFFWWNATTAQMSFSSQIDGDGKEVFETSTGSRKLKWSNEHPYFEQKGKDLFLAQEIKGIPTFIEFRALIKNFISMIYEFNDQSMGSFSHCFK